MGKYSTYGMTGVGIAAAIGFVFALTILNNTNPLGTGDEELVRQTQPNADSAFLFHKQESADADNSAVQKSAPSSQQEMTTLQQTAELRPTLLTVTAVDGTTEAVTEIAPGSRFTVGKPYFVQAHFINPNETAVLDQTLIMTLERNGTGHSANGTLLEEAANFRGDIGANQNVDLEFYWNPDAEGEYTLLVFSLTQSDLSTESKEPILSIPIQAVSE
jgi:hypothetical protein